MDERLDRLRLSVMNTWFPTDGKLFLNSESEEPEDLVELFFLDFIEQYKTAFPAVQGRMYEDQVSTDPLPIQSIDIKLLRILGVTHTLSPHTFRYDTNTALTGRGISNVDTLSTSPYMSEQAAMDLYTHITVDEWSGRLDRPIIMYDDTDDTEFIIPNMGDFIIIYLKERTLTADSIPSSLYPSVEAFLLYNLAATVLHALGRYPVSLAMADIGNTTTSTLDPSSLSSVTISGKLTLSMSASAQKAYERLSDLFSSGSGSKYMEDIEYIFTKYQKIFDVLKYTRLNGISVT